MDAALEHWTAACDALDAALPATPDVLRCRGADFEMFRALRRTRTEGDFYTKGEVGMLLAKPRTRPLYEIVENATGARVEVASPREFSGGDTYELQGRSIPCPVAQARADAIIAAWEDHKANCEALQAFHACEGAEAAYNGALRVRQGLGDAIAAARATTIPGLAVRARILAGLQGVDDGEEDGAEYETLTVEDMMVAAILRDLAAMASYT